MLQRADLDQIYAAAPGRLRRGGRRPGGHERTPPGRHRPGRPAGAHPAAQHPGGHVQHPRDAGGRHVLRACRQGPARPGRAACCPTRRTSSRPSSSSPTATRAPPTAWPPASPRAASRSRRVPIPDTEAAKTFATAQHVAGRLADVALHTNDLVVAVGGEPVFDLAGFVAATFNRGTRLALVPTTLVAQADSAIGGKNAVNMPQGRNLVGAIHQPTVVIADVTTACENVEHGFRAGLAEIAKHALISRSDLLEVAGGALRRRPLGRHGRRAAAGDPQRRDQGRHRQPGRARHGRADRPQLRPHVRACDRSGVRAARGPGRVGGPGHDGRGPSRAPPGTHRRRRGRPASAPAVDAWGCRPRGGSTWSRCSARGCGTRSTGTACASSSSTDWGTAEAGVTASADMLADVLEDLASA